MSLETQIEALVAAINNHAALVADNTATMRALAGQNVVPITTAPAPAPAKAEKPKKEKPAPAPVVEEKPAEFEVEETEEPVETDPVALRKQVQEYCKIRITTDEGPEFKQAFSAELAKRGFSKAIELPDDQLLDFLTKAKTW
jgi:hypothetical protein